VVVTTIMIVFGSLLPGLGWFAPQSLLGRGSRLYHGINYTNYGSMSEMTMFRQLGSVSGQSFNSELVVVTDSGTANSRQ
jgi:hypothetical protein